MQLSNAAAFPPAPARAAWRSQSVASALKEFAVGPVTPVEPVVPVVPLGLLVLLGGGRGVEVCGAHAGNNSNSNQSALGFMIHPTGVAVNLRNDPSPNGDDSPLFLILPISAGQARPLARPIKFQTRPSVGLPLGHVVVSAIRCL